MCTKGRIFFSISIYIFVSTDSWILTLFNGLQLITVLISFDAQIFPDLTIRSPFSWFLYPFDRSLSFFTRTSLTFWQQHVPRSSCTFMVPVLKTENPFCIIVSIAKPTLTVRLSGLNEMTKLQLIEIHPFNACMVSNSVMSDSL